MIDKMINDVDLPLVTIIASTGRFIRFTKAQQIGNDSAVTRVDKYWDHLAIEVGPARFAMDKQHDRAVGRTFVQVVDSIAVYILVVSIIVLAGQVFESLIGSSIDSWLYFISMAGCEGDCECCDY